MHRSPIARSTCNIASHGYTTSSNSKDAPSRSHASVPLLLLDAPAPLPQTPRPPISTSRSPRPPSHTARALPQFPHAPAPNPHGGHHRLRPRRCVRPRQLHPPHGAAVRHKQRPTAVRRHGVRQAEAGGGAGPVHAVAVLPGYEGGVGGAARVWCKDGCRLVLSRDMGSPCTVRGGTWAAHARCGGDMGSPCTVRGGHGQPMHGAGGTGCAP